jgi:hypothetical protein
LDEKMAMNVGPVKSEPLTHESIVMNQVWGGIQTIKSDIDRTNRILGWLAIGAYVVVLYDLLKGGAPWTRN